MADIERTADAVWQGGLRGGKGEVSAPSGVLKQEAYSFITRFENAPGTNPEELVAAAHAACFSMAFSAALEGKGFKPEKIATHATLLMNKGPSGFRITGMRLEVTGIVPGIDETTFKQIAVEAEKGCPISALLRPGLKDNVEVIAKLQ